ncbi:putative nucleotide-diphospho-sugar transferase [Hymenobacter sp. DG25B]|uniref:putative nucleotide-diphospho-sugar transferase n=1 Tax=Hymenobacter sp. DG25B TaxID=1385664 RepID=UPI0012E02D11|nr:putative nucleotide-diphospho-sugar transferase [Hymenobacter sp. DG25B]
MNKIYTSKIMKIEKTFVFSIALGGYALLFRKCINSHKEYCQKYGYEYKIIDKSKEDLTPSAAAWLKIVMIINALESGYESVFFIDADCLVRSHTPPVEDVFTEGQSIYMANGHSGRLNSGIIIVKNTPEALDFFKNVLNNCEKPVPDEDFAIYENGHMIHYGKTNPAVGVIPYELWNNTVAIDERSYIQHYSGGGLRITYLDENNLRWFNRCLIMFKKINKPKLKVALKQRMIELKNDYSLSLN